MEQGGVYEVHAVGAAQISSASNLQAKAALVRNLLPAFVGDKGAASLAANLARQMTADLLVVRLQADGSWSAYYGT